MPFNKEAFMAAQYAARTEVVEVPVLSPFFAEGDKPEFTLRSLDAEQIQRARDAVEKNKGVDNLIKAVSSNKDQIEAVREVLGMSSTTPGEIVYRLELLVMGVQSPEIDLPFAVKMAHNHQHEFTQLTNRILLLSGKGFDLVKHKAASRKTRS